MILEIIASTNVVLSCVCYILAIIAAIKGIFYFSQLRKSCVFITSGLTDEGHKKLLADLSLLTDKTFLNKYKTNRWGVQLANTGNVTLMIDSIHISKYRRFDSNIPYRDRFELNVEKEGIVAPYSRVVFEINHKDDDLNRDLKYIHIFYSDGKKQVIPCGFDRFLTIKLFFKDIWLAIRRHIR